MIHNSILWGNSAGLIGGEWTAEDRSLIEGGFGGRACSTPIRLCQQRAGDYTLAAGSPAIDA